MLPVIVIVNASRAIFSACQLAAACVIGARAVGCTVAQLPGVLAAEQAISLFALSSCPELDRVRQLAEAHCLPIVVTTSADPDGCSRELEAALRDWAARANTDL